MSLIDAIKEYSSNDIVRTADVLPRRLEYDIHEYSNSGWNNGSQIFNYTLRDTWNNNNYREQQYVDYVDSINIAALCDMSSGDLIPRGSCQALLLGTTYDFQSSLNNKYTLGCIIEFEYIEGFNQFSTDIYYTVTKCLTPNIDYRKDFAKMHRIFLYYLGGSLPLNKVILSVGFLKTDLVNYNY